MQPQTRPQLLESWLRSTSGSGGGGGAPSRPPPPPSAQSILQSWSDLRSPSTHSHLSALQTLASSLHSLHLSDPQAKLLLSLLPSNPSSPLLLLLSAYLRKSPRPSPPILDQTLSLLPQIPPSPHSILLLGSLSAAAPSQQLSLDLLVQFLENHPSSLWSNDDLIPEILAGIGYALSKSPDSYFSRIFSSFLGVWNEETGPRPSLGKGFMMLSLLEWVASGFVKSGDWKRIELLCVELSVEKCGERGYGRFAVVMAAAGVLRAVHRMKIDAKVRSSLEGTIGFVAQHVVSGVVSENSLLLQCILLGLVRCGGLTSFNGSVLSCLYAALSKEIFPLWAFSGTAGFDKVKEHLDSVLFKEAGAVTGVFCRQYELADEGCKGVVEDYIWGYSRDLYSHLRVAALVYRGRTDDLIRNLEKIAEAAFLMVVVFAAEVTKQKSNPKSSSEIRQMLSVKILVAFSCVEYLRRVRLPEYTDVVRRAVLAIQENAAACASFVELMPPYAELTNQNGAFTFEGIRYIWYEDDVQTARLLFYLRVIPTCISLLSASMFGQLVASTMFLYMQHPNEKVARASHSVFVAFMSSGKDSDQDERLALKEQLVFYYIQRALEAYPGVTPSEGLVSGVVSLVRNLPAGSPAIFYCIDSLVGKATDLFKTAMSEDSTMWKTWEASSEPLKKVLDLLLRLISLVDIQVFPYLLKKLAEFVVHLPEDGQNVLLDEMYSRVAESDDVTRKPLLVSWLQSLSYLCSQGSKSSSKAGSASIAGTLLSSDDLNSNLTSSRL